MTTVKILKRQSEVIGFEVTGHSGWAQSGKDIVCASISSAVQLVANGITECARVKAAINMNDNTIRLEVQNHKDADAARILLNSFQLHMELLSEQYKKNICIEIMEV